MVLGDVTSKAAPDLMVICCLRKLQPTLEIIEVLDENVHGRNNHLVALVNNDGFFEANTEESLD